MFCRIVLANFQKIQIASLLSIVHRSDTRKGMHFSVTKRLRREPWCWYLARRTFGTRKLLGILSTVLCVAECARNFCVGAHKAVGRETSETPNSNRRVESLLVALKPSRRPNNRPTDIHGREVDRDGVRWPGLHPGGKSPRRNQHDRDLHGRIRTMLPESFRITFGDRRFRSQRGADSYIAGELRRSCRFVPISSRGVRRNCFLLSRTHLIPFRCDFLDLFGVSNKDFFCDVKEKFTFENAFTEHEILVREEKIALHKHRTISVSSSYCIIRNNL